MNKAVETYIQNRRAKIEQEKCKKATALLARERVMDEVKEYAPPGTEASFVAFRGYSNSEQVDGELRYYKFVKKPVEAGSEECKALEEVLLLEREYNEGVFSNQEGSLEFEITPAKQEYEQSAISKAFRIIAFVVWIGGVIMAFTFGRDRYDDISLPAFLGILAGFGVAGVFPLAISQALDYLGMIAQNTSCLRAKIVSSNKK